MTTLHSFKDNSTSCFANIRMEDGEPIYISVAQSSVIVKKSRVGLFGQNLFESISPEHAIKTAQALDQAIPDQKVPADMRNPVLRAFTNAVLHCRSLDDVSKTLHHSANMQNRKSVFDERSRLMGSAMRKSVLWGVVAQAIWFAAYLATSMLEGQWTYAGYNGFLVFPLVAAGYFIWKRRRILQDLDRRL